MLHCDHPFCTHVIVRLQHYLMNYVFRMLEYALMNQLNLLKGNFSIWKIFEMTIFEELPKMSHFFTQKSSNFLMFLLKTTMLTLSISSKFDIIGKLSEYCTGCNHNYLEMYFHVASKTNFMIRNHISTTGTHIYGNTHILNKDCRIISYPKQ